MELAKHVLLEISIRLVVLMEGSFIVELIGSQSVSVLISESFNSTHLVPSCFWRFNSLIRNSPYFKTIFELL